jgi:hypothetical protein
VKEVLDNAGMSVKERGDKKSKGSVNIVHVVMVHGNLIAKKKEQINGNPRSLGFSVLQRDRAFRRGLENEL